MLVHMSIYKIKPEKMPNASRVLLSQQEKIRGLDARGLRQAFFIESLDESGMVIWLSIWESLRDVRDFLSSPCNAAIATSLTPYLQNAPEWYEFKILEPVVS